MTSFLPPSSDHSFDHLSHLRLGAEGQSAVRTDADRDRHKDDRTLLLHPLSCHLVLQISFLVSLS
jgi:hypothetical protein